MAIDYKVYNKKYLLGDIHGYWSIIANHVVHNEEENIAYIQVGDFNIGFNPIEKEVERLTQLNQILNTYKCDLYIMRGNHDNPMWFKNENFADIKANLNRIFFVPDYTVINMDLENILFVGGAVSIDRVPSRFKPYDAWWEDEAFVLDKDKLNGFEDIERVITHTCPDFCDPINFNGLVYNYAKNDATLLDDLKKERKLVTEMANILMFNGKNKLRGWYYGHFHNNYRLIHHNMEFVCLDIDKFMQL